ncbi:helix-turn-helix domain-containing protein [Vibrio diabolicus]|uniref:helix-turn-helix domain-containing protein n=1 Tax=Vibrio diabolicus TaxID=50719 RepID=UPI003D7DB086
MAPSDNFEPITTPSICTVLEDLDSDADKHTTFNSITAVVLKELRLQHNFSQRSFAEQLGIPLQTYAKIEQGNTRINIDTLFRVANVSSINKSPNERVFAAIIVDTVGRYADFLVSCGWEVLSSLSDAKEPKGDDLFIARANEYYKRTAKQMRWGELHNGVPLLILNSPMKINGAFIPRGLEVFHEAGCIPNPGKENASTTSSLF